MQQRPRLHDNNSANPSKSKRATEILTQLKIHQNGTRQRFSSAIMQLFFGSSPSNGRSQQRQTPRLSSSSTQKLQHRLHHPTACICPTGIIRSKKGPLCLMLALAAGGAIQRAVRNGKRRANHRRAHSSTTFPALMIQSLLPDNCLTLSSTVK